MAKLLRTVVIYLIFRNGWRKLLVVCLIFTFTSILILISSLPYPLTEWIHLPHPATSSSSNSVRLGENHFSALGARHEIVQDNSVVVPHNSSTEPNKTVLLEKKEKDVPQRSKGHRRGRLMDSIGPPSPHMVKRLPRQLERYLSSLSPDEALAFVRKDIENASRDSGDNPELYAPLFRNVSTFMRSYEWMEQILKVYIYKEGEKPIFQEPHLSGIYASEGWFLRLMLANRHFVTKDPEKAHLFYLPYSARQLQMTLYVPGSHNLNPLIVFLRDYVNMLSSKYRYWNRTRGSDHFIVACHDWGPYTLKGHKELLQNTIKALCNADASEGIFDPRKDVSLPETTIRRPRRPLRNIGGKKVSERSILAFFSGRRHGKVRPELLKHWSDKDDDMRIYGPLPNRVSRFTSYPQLMKSSKYCICPMGFDVNSPRIVESIYYECVPVIIADNLVLPFSDVLDWDAFSFRVPEKDIPNLKEILLAIPMERYIVMQNNVKKLQRHFLWNFRPVPFDLFHMILHSLWSSRLKQIQTLLPS
ncbi:probable glycosyltransferase At5g03795 [Andrographis paniculata]|uniref:probable glycosyltransferase At5g03795 n=1 Tax=Andrographis paniculata TaxID=175694 RepID=UPI0021E72A09|nr:probable glycosyltransferase At5g03795 [Andrographis paniculata]XP_051115294.1 probable glycosyltransferase At5g03795 [Andrographis paniculata]XP_051115296.1 probable glycosyltransferase At5g03795 [Andrographis paniculata]